MVCRVKYTSRVGTLDEGLMDPEGMGEAGKADEGILWDANRPLEGDCQLRLYTF